MHRRRRAVAQPSLAQFLLLSVLLHVLLVLTFGTTDRGAGGGEAGGRAQDLDVALVPDSGYRVAMRPRADSGGSVAPPVRRGGATAARSPLLPRRDAPRAAAPAVESLPRLDRGAPEIVNRAIEPSVEAPSPKESSPEPIPRLEPDVPRDAEPIATPAPPIAAPREVAPVVAPPAAAASANVERDVTPVIEPPLPVEPEIKPAPMPAPVEAPPVISPPVIAPPVIAPPVIAPPVIAPPIAAPAIAEPRPIEAPPAPALVPAPAPAAAPAKASTPASAAAQRAPAESPRAREIESPRPAIIAPSREAPAPGAPLRFGTPPTPEEELFKARKPDTEVESVLPIGKAPRLNLDKEKPDAVAGRSDKRKGVLNLFPPPPEKESKLARDIQKAAQPDCRDAYAAMGLLAVPLLLKDTITDTGCRW